MVEVYGFSGKLGSGKDYIAKLFRLLMPKKNTVRIAFADHFKVECCARNHDVLTYDRVFNKKDDESRKKLQEYGTKGREENGEDYWVNVVKLWTKVHEMGNVERIIITDVRYKNEAEWLKSVGGILFRVDAPKRNKTQLERECGGDLEKLKSIATHPSEVDLDDYEYFDYIINNDADQLTVTNQVRNIVREMTYEHPVELTIFCDMDDTICRCSEFYRTLTSKAMELVAKETGIEEEQLTKLVQKHVLSYEKRYFTHDDFAHSLMNVAAEAFVQQGIAYKLKDSYVMDEVLKLGESVFDQDYAPLYKDTIEIVRELSKIGRLVIFTLGDYTEQMRKVAMMGLEDIPVEIFAHKDESIFRHLKANYPSNKYVMIGDSWGRDIIPAMNAGIKNLIHVIGGRSLQPSTLGVDQELWDKVLHIQLLDKKLINIIQDMK